MKPAVRGFRCAFVLVAAVLASGCQALFFGVVNGGGASAPKPFVYDAEHDLALDVYTPATPSQAAPVVLFFYGGSWRNGSRSDYAFVGRALAERGVVVIPDYRKAPAALFPAFEIDAANAARWTFDHATEIGGDPRRIFVAGHSAGGQIAALLATDARYLAADGLKPRDFAGAIGIAGPYDFLPLTDPDLVEVFGPEAEWPASQPVNFVDGDEPPFLLLQGTGDRVVDPRNMVSLASRLETAHVPVTQIRYPSIGHFRIVGALRYPSLAPTLDDVAHFIETTPRADR
jgi:acetyl esterase/lipase